MKLLKKLYFILSEPFWLIFVNSKNITNVEILLENFIRTYFYSAPRQILIGALLDF
jgi:hypothetical protein